MTATVQTTSTSEDSGTSHVIDLPSGIVAGDLIIVFYHSTADSTSVWPAGWTLIDSQQQGVSGMETEIYFRDADGTEGASITVTSPGSEGATGHAVYRIDGHDSATPPEATLADGDSISPNPPSLTPSGGSQAYLWLVAFALNALGSITTRPDNYTDEVDLTWAGGEMSSMQRDLEASSEDPTIFVVGADDVWVASTVVIFPAAAVGGAKDFSFDAGDRKKTRFRI